VPPLDSPGFAFGDQGRCPWTLPKGSSTPLDFPFVWFQLGRSGAQQARRMTGLGGGMVSQSNLAAIFFLVLF